MLALHSHPVLQCLPWLIQVSSTRHGCTPNAAGLWQGTPVDLQRRVVCRQKRAMQQTADRVVAACLFDTRNDSHFCKHTKSHLAAASELKVIRAGSCSSLGTSCAMASTPWKPRSSQTSAQSPLRGVALCSCPSSTLPSMPMVRLPPSYLPS